MEFRGFRLIATWGDNECEYGFIIKTGQNKSAIITGVSWFGNLGAVFPQYKAIYKDGKWELELISMAIS